jgi:hypothetical protein
MDRLEQVERTAVKKAIAEIRAGAPTSDVPIRDLDKNIIKYATATIGVENTDDGSNNAILWSVCSHETHDVLFEGFVDC